MRLCPKETNQNETKKLVPLKCYQYITHCIVEHRITQKSGWKKIKYTVGRLLCVNLYNNDRKIIFSFILIVVIIYTKRGICKISKPKETLQEKQNAHTHTYSQ